MLPGQVPVAERVAASASGGIFSSRNADRLSSVQRSPSIWRKVTFTPKRFRTPWLTWVSNRESNPRSMNDSLGSVWL